MSSYMLYVLLTICSEIGKSYWPFFPNVENWNAGNWQIATDILMAIIKAQEQNFQHKFKDCVTRNTCNRPKLRNEYINIYFIIVYQCKYFVFCIEMNDVSNPHWKFCFWDLKFEINVSEATCRLSIC